MDKDTLDYKLEHCFCLVFGVAKPFPFSGNPHVDVQIL